MAQFVMVSISILFLYADDTKELPPDGLSGLLDDNSKAVFFKIY
jgi:hypothetical protein